MLDKVGGVINFTIFVCSKYMMCCEPMSQARIVKIFLCVAAVFLLASFEGKAQRMAVSSDLVQWALVSPNLGFEVALSQHHAFAFSASTCPVKVSDRLSVSHLSMSPEYKYWFRMPFYGHYAGADILYSSYEIGGSRYARTGNLVAACANYGYSFIIGKRWNIVPHAGLGVGVDVGEKTSFVPVVAKIGLNIQMVVR